MEKKSNNVESESPDEDWVSKHQKIPRENEDQRDDDDDVDDEDEKNENDHNEEETNFDFIIGCIEDIVISEEFQDLQENLLESNYEYFDEKLEENKLIYTDIYKEYTKQIEDFIEENLRKRIENFDMKDFLRELELRRADLEGEVFDMLFTLTDFLAFKEMFVDYKVMKQAGAFDNVLSVSNLESEN